VPHPTAVAVGSDLLVIIKLKSAIFGFTNKKFFKRLADGLDGNELAV
jgi:hypothetical protein